MLLITSLLLTFFIEAQGLPLECPLTDTSTERYILAPLVPDLTADGVHKDVLSDTELYSQEVALYRGYNLRIHFKILNDFDVNKPMMFILPGGPGPFSIIDFISKAFPFLAEKFNLVEMSHRGVGCSSKQFFFEIPHFSYFMRFAAHDMNQIRKTLYGATSTQKIYLYGSSYGSFLAQQYAVMYPQLVEKMYLRDTSISAENSNSNNNLDSIKEMMQEFYKNTETQKILNLKSEDFLVKFFKLSANLWRSQEGRLHHIPTLLKASTQPDGENAVLHSLEEIQNSPLVPPMIASIYCLEMLPSISLNPNNIFNSSELTPICKIYQNSYQIENFDFKKYAINVKSKILIINGKWDLITPASKAKEMTSYYKNASYFEDTTSGHGELTNINHACHSELLTQFVEANWNPQTLGIGDNCSAH